MAIDGLIVHVNFQAVTPITMVAHRLFYFDAIMGVDGLGTKGLQPEVRTVQMWKQPIFDRRVARRISRYTGMRFHRKQSGEYVFKGAPRRMR